MLRHIYDAVNLFAINTEFQGISMTIFKLSTAMALAVLATSSAFAQTPGASDRAQIIQGAAGAGGATNAAVGRVSPQVVGGVAAGVALAAALGSSNGGNSGGGFGIGPGGTTGTGTTGTTGTR
ncbi:hypothetical protein [Variovorax sp. Varisp36]